LKINVKNPVFELAPVLEYEDDGAAGDHYLTLKVGYFSKSTKMITRGLEIEQIWPHGRGLNFLLCNCLI